MVLYLNAKGVLTILGISRLIFDILLLPEIRFTLFVTPQNRHSASVLAAHRI